MGQKCPPVSPVQEARGCFLIPEVVGLGTEQVLVANQIELPEAAIAIQGVDTEVDVTGCQVCQGKVIFNAVVTENITFKTCEDSDTQNDIDIVKGTIRHATFFIPVSGFVEIPGAQAGDECCVEFAGLDADCRTVEPVNVAEDGTFDRIMAKQILLFAIKALRPTQVTLDLVTGDGFLCPAATPEQAAAGRIPSRCLPVGPVQVPQCPECQPGKKYH